MVILLCGVCLGSILCLHVTVFPSPSRDSCGQTRWRWLHPGASVLPRADAEAGCQLGHLPCRVYPSASPRSPASPRPSPGLLPPVRAALARGGAGGRARPELRARAEAHGQAVAEEGVELAVHGRQRHWSPVLPRAARAARLQMAGDAQAGLGQRLRRGTEARGALSEAQHASAQTLLAPRLSFCRLGQTQRLHL